MKLTFDNVTLTVQKVLYLIVPQAEQIMYQSAQLELKMNNVLLKWVGTAHYMVPSLPWPYSRALKKKQ